MKFRELKQLYETTKKDGGDRFYVGDKVVLVSYAKYMIEYIDSQGVGDED